jgi:hypothetical protein
VNAEQVTADVVVITEAYARKAWELFVRLWGWIRWEVFYRWYAAVSVELYEQRQRETQARPAG